MSQIHFYKLLCVSLASYLALLMTFSLRTIRKYLGIGYGNPKSWSRKLFYISILFVICILITLLNVRHGPNLRQLTTRLHEAAAPQAIYQQQQRPYRLSGLETVRKIDGQEYPKLTSDGKFIPIRKIVHLDLKGGAFKPAFFPKLFHFFKKIGLTGILIEWEDMFPYTGKLAEAINGDAYSISEIEGILKSAKENQLNIIPLVQTFGHLEWILKLKQFKHLREDIRYPQVICFANEEAFDIIKDMIDQVVAIHKKYGMEFFHMGADEAFQVGFCNETIKQMLKEGSKDRVMLWHISRVAKYIKDTHSTTVLAWHDMFGHVAEDDLRSYNMTEVLEPVLWSYAEDLEEYIPFSSWEALKPFKNVWGSSAFKGADGPMKINSNPMHYIKNHESWIIQMSKAYQEFDYFQGLIITGWSRYDHMAVLAELLPVNLPTLVMCLETIESGRPLLGNYAKSNELLHCAVKYDNGYNSECLFPGHKIYKLVNKMHSEKESMHKYIETDFDFNGWLSKIAEKYHFSSPMYIEKIRAFIDYNLEYLENIEKDLRIEMRKIYFNETIEEFIFTYLSDELELLRKRKSTMSAILSASTYQKRPYIKYPSKQ
uniref:Beta-N-acetylhexosaminidase n=1 Tax=Panagrolaimus sp. ES5 TaxID=591445 RepID=A0AC34FKX6_9BILA